MKEINQEKQKIKDLYNRYANNYQDNFIPPTFKTARTALSFCNDITWHFLKKYLPEDYQSRLIDVGGGDGYWSEKILKLGYQYLTLTDFSPQMLDLARKRLKNFISRHSKASFTPKIQYIEADICSMDHIPSYTFDFTFSLFDPVSYSLKPLLALQELARITKKQGIVFASLDTKYRRVPELLEADQIPAALHLLESNYSYDFQHAQYNFTWQELKDYYNSVGLEVLDIIGAPVFIHQVNPTIIEKLEANSSKRAQILQIELEYCQERSLINNAGHLIMVGRKSQ